MPYPLFRMCFALALGSSLAGHAAPPSWLVRPEIEAGPDVITYTGAINEEGAREVIDLIATRRFKTLVVESRGGLILPGMAIGRAVHGAGMDVEIKRKCVSACANYIFPAGKKKAIPRGALVLWHGDARQLNFIEAREILEHAVAVNPGALTPEEKKQLEGYRRDMNQQEDFYREIGIRDGIARLGHGFSPRVPLWTVSVHTISLFGINSVEAPEGYGWPDYCLHEQHSYSALSVTCLGDDLPSSISNLIQ